MDVEQRKRLEMSEGQRNNARGWVAKGSGTEWRRRERLLLLSWRREHKRSVCLHEGHPDMSFPQLGHVHRSKYQWPLNSRSSSTSLRSPTYHDRFPISLSPRRVPHCPEKIHWRARGTNRSTIRHNNCHPTFVPVTTLVQRLKHLLSILQ